LARDMETVSRLQPLVMQISSSIYTVGQHGSSYLKGLKCALSFLIVSLSAPSDKSLQLIDPV
jgi:2-dehydro-3-deoxy-D-pentonate aldolase